MRMNEFRAPLKLFNSDPVGGVGGVEESDGQRTERDCGSAQDR